MTTLTFQASPQTAQIFEFRDWVLRSNGRQFLNPDRDFSASIGMANEVRDWCRENLLTMPYECPASNPCVTNIISLTFANDDDAMLFKLRWM